jgi:hypothetical protein
VVGPLEHLRHASFGFGVGISRSALASQVTDASLGIGLTLGKTSELSKLGETPADHNFSLGLSSRDGLIEHLVEFFPRDQITFIEVEIIE